MLIIATTIAAAAAFAPVVPMSDSKSVKSVAPVCQRVETQTVRKAGGRTTRKLNEEPNSDIIAAVLYNEGPCSRPIVINRNLGSNPKRK